MQNYYITTPIYYVNDKPHIGHAYTTIACDVIARFQRLSGKNVKFLTGTDEHGQKVQKAAEFLKQDPQNFVDAKAKSFKELNILLNISNDDFIRTTEKRHVEAVQHFWLKLLGEGYIYLDKYSGWYSVRDEAFYSESELTPDGKAPTGAEVEWVEEESYFFKLSAFQEKLLKFYDDNPNFILPKYRMNEVKNFVKSGLKDLSISRTSFDWGIKVPNNPKHVIYVWLDALTNYISAIGYPDSNGEIIKYWPADAHVVGKDILRFHAIYWPAFLMAAELPLPKQVIAHGWWMSEGEKMSKSIGNVIDPVKILQDYSSDAFRYFLMREMAFGNDGNFVYQNFVLRNNSELANKIGNLFQRSLSLINKYYEGRVPEISNITDLYQKQEPLQNALNLYNSIKEAFDEFDFNKALEFIIRFTDKINEYIDKLAPWSLLKTDKSSAGEVLYVVIEALRYIAILLQPFIPDACDKMLNQLGISYDNRKFENLTIHDSLLSGTKLGTISPIFTKFDI